MKTQINPGPPDESGNDVKNNPVPRKPCGQKGRHHESVERMSTRKTGIEDFSRTLRYFGKRLQKNKGPLAVDEKFKSIDHSGLDTIKKKEIKHSLSLFHGNETKNKENNDSDMASEMGDPGNHLVQHR
jgi:hypothetical protein